MSYVSILPMEKPRNPVLHQAFDIGDFNWVPESPSALGEPTGLVPEGAWDDPGAGGCGFGIAFAFC
jgi:hypothetical protein